MLNLFGRDYEELGSSDKGIVLKGKVKIQWGNKFVDLLDSDGHLNTEDLRYRIEQLEQKLANLEK